VETKRRIAYLAPELPSATTAFVHEEILHLTEAGYRVAAFSLDLPPRKNLPSEAADIARNVTALHGNPVATMTAAAKFAVNHPARAWRAIALAADDFANGRFDGKEKRAALPLRVIAALALAERLLAENVAHLHVHFTDAPATIGMYAAAAAEIPLTITAHDTDLYCLASLLDRKIQRAAAFTTVSLANRGYLLELLGTQAAKVQVVHSGIDVATFPPRSAESGADSNVVFAAGPLVPRKGFDVLLYAIALLGDARPDIRVAVAGAGPQRQRLEELAVRLNIRDRISLLGNISRDDIRTHLAAAGLFALPCREALSGDRDAIPIALVEAMACAVPVISTRFSGIPELVEHEHNGLLVDPDDPVDLAATIVRLLDDAALRRRLQAQARESVKAQFDLAATTLQLADVFEHAIGRYDAEKAHRAQSQAPVRGIRANKNSRAAGAAA